MSSTSSLRPPMTGFTLCRATGENKIDGETYLDDGCELQRTNEVVVTATNEGDTQFCDSGRSVPLENVPRGDTGSSLVGRIRDMDAALVMRCSLDNEHATSHFAILDWSQKGEKKLFPMRHRPAGSTKNETWEWQVIDNVVEDVSGRRHESLNVSQTAGGSESPLDARYFSDTHRNFARAVYADCETDVIHYAPVRTYSDKTKQHTVTLVFPDDLDVASVTPNTGYSSAFDFGPRLIVPDRDGKRARHWVYALVHESDFDTDRDSVKKTKREMATEDEEGDFWL